MGSVTSVLDQSIEERVGQESGVDKQRKEKKSQPSFLSALGSVVGVGRDKGVGGR